MATPTPSSLFLRLANTWRHLALRSDVDDIVLELLGRFSLEKIYAVAAAGRDAYQQLVIGLLSQLKAIFDLQRLTIPPENVHVGWYLGFLVSWEVAVRSVEFVLQTVAEGRESLWEHRQLRDGHLAEFLLSALRVLSLHPKAPTNQRARDRRERFARIHGSLEQVFDSYPGPKSFLLEVCKEVTGQLHSDPDALALPPSLKSDLPTLTAELVRIISPNEPRSAFSSGAACACLGFRALFADGLLVPPSSLPTTRLHIQHCSAQWLWQLVGPVPSSARRGPVCGCRICPICRQQRDARCAPSVFFCPVTERRLECPGEPAHASLPI
jgi:hypothetical protein